MVYIYAANIQLNIIIILDWAEWQGAEPNSDCDSRLPVGAAVVQASKKRDASPGAGGEGEEEGILYGLT